MKFARIADILYLMDKIVRISLRGAHIFVKLTDENTAQDIRFNTRAEAKEAFEELANS